MLFQGINLVS
jgi:hypothetical protein